MKRTSAPILFAESLESLAQLSHDFAVTCDHYPHEGDHAPKEGAWQDKDVLLSVK